jgi:hypothetical protein
MRWVEASGCHTTTMLERLICRSYVLVSLDSLNSSQRSNTLIPSGRSGGKSFVQIHP